MQTKPILTLGVVAGALVLPVPCRHWAWAS